MSNRKIKRRVGDVVAVPISEGRRSFAIVLDEPTIAFFDILTTNDRTPSPGDMLNSRELFRLWVMNHAIERGTWPVVSHTRVPPHMLTPQPFFKQDPISGKLSITTNGADEEPASRAQCLGLERAAVWDPRHIVDRLEDHFSGRENKWLESLRLK